MIAQKSRLRPAIIAQMSVAGIKTGQKNKKEPSNDDSDGAVDEARTRDLHLGKVALYQLSYYRKTACAVDGRWSG